jgi:hypothetical protein
MSKLASVVFSAGGGGSLREKGQMKKLVVVGNDTEP